ncbi:MAG TPA: hypothetical protein VKG84_08280, partial [Candidatus Acidoferrales bacterium]|nr:hypothetical protein [Candidatus Acidoferrales bacterium]
CDAVSGNVVANCGFETGDLTGWTTGGPGLALGLVGVDGPPSVPFDTNSGNFGAFLAGFNAPLTLSQTLNVETGDILTLTFWVGQNTDGAAACDSTCSFAVSLGGQTLLMSPTTTIPGTFTEFTYSIIAPSNSVVLQFSAENDPDVYSLDDISVVTPEPQPLILLAPALAGLVLLRRRG